MPVRAVRQTSQFPEIWTAGHEKGSKCLRIFQARHRAGWPEVLTHMPGDDEHDRAGTSEARVSVDASGELGSSVKCGSQQEVQASEDAAMSKGVMGRSRKDCRAEKNGGHGNRRQPLRCPPSDGHATFYRFPRGASNSGASAINCYSGGRKLVPARGSR